MQRESATLALEEQRAKVEKLNAEAAKIMSEAQGGNGMEPEYEQALRQIQEQAAAKLEAMADQLRKVQMDAANKTMAINRDADVKIEAARIDASSRERVAEIQNAAAKQMDSLMARLDEMNKAMGEVGKQAQEAARAAEAAAKTAEKVGKGAEDAAKKADEAGKMADQAVKAAEKVSGEVEKAAKHATEKPAKAEAAAPAPQPAPVTINFEAGAIQVDAKQPAGSKTLTMQVGDKTMTGTIDTKGDKT
jgi:chromosome segregation ATPase